VQALLRGFEQRCVFRQLRRAVPGVKAVEMNAQCLLLLGGQIEVIVRLPCNDMICLVVDELDRAAAGQDDESEQQQEA